MQTFAIKHRAQLTWEDLPFVEAPVFAHTHIMQMLNNPNHLWMRIENLPEFIRTEIGSYSSLRNHDYANNQIERLIGSGLYFNVCRTGKPFCAAFTWQEDPEHPHKGFWTDPLNYYWRASVAIKNQLMLIANQWHRLQTQNNSDESSLDEWISKADTVAYAADPFTAKGMNSGYALSPREQLKYISPTTEKSEIKPVDYLGIVDDTLADMELFSMEKDAIDMDTLGKDVRESESDDLAISKISSNDRLNRLLSLSSGLALGSKGDNVLELQKELGFTGRDLDGHFGGKTNALLKSKIAGLREYEENVKLLEEPVVKAFLSVLGFKESGNRYDVITGGEKFTDFSKHPNIKVWFKKADGSEYPSTASGAYQFTYDTWNEYGVSKGLPDFSPKSQDLAAISLLRELDVISELQVGNIEKAIYKAGKRWDAFPLNSSEVSISEGNRPLKPIKDLYDAELSKLNAKK